MWTAFSFALSAAACLCAFRAWQLAASTASVVRALQELVKRSPLSRLESCENSIAELTETLNELAQRVKMQRVRNAITHGEAAGKMPDPHKDPDGWRAAMNRKLAGGRLPQ